MKFYNFLLLQIIFSLSVAAQDKPSKFYNQKIFLTATDDALLQQAVTDLQQCLQKATNKIFSVTPASGRVKEGIQILLLQPGLLSSSLSQQLQKGSSEDFVMEGNANHLLLVANHSTGLLRAIYTYLDRLGFKWYLPGEEWSIVPFLTSITLTSSTYHTPSFKLRDFFGTGGILPIKPIDPNSTVEKLWEEWKRRNRFGGQFHLDGHYGETFNFKYKELLQKNPQFLAQVNGKRQWSEIAKWCISNKEFRALFLADRIKELEQRLQASTYQNEIIAITVDPADGGGDCECEVCRKMGTANDRIFYLANETAIALQKKSQRGYANIYAYNNHPSPPQFELSDHLIVQVVPYAFQTVSKPEELITTWKKRHSNLFIYDYYGIPDWHQDTPLTDGWNTQNFFKRLPFWKAQNLQGFVFESSYSSACTGIGLYIAGRLGWNISENRKGIQEAFVKEFFGAASSHVAMYYQKLENGFAGAADLPFLLDQLQKGSNSTTDAKVQERLTQLKAYAHYLVLYYKLKSATSNREQVLENLYQYLFQIYPRAVVHSTYLAQMLYQQFENKNAAQKAWSLFEPVGSKVQQTKFLDNVAIEQLFVEDYKQYPLLRGFAYLPKKTKLQYSIKQPKAENAMMKDGLLIAEFPQTLVKPSTNGNIVFSIKVNEASANNDSQSFFIQLIDTITGTEIAKQKLNINKVWMPVSLKATAGKTYRLVIKNTNWIRFAVPPTQWLAFKTIPTYAVLGRLWFYNENNEYLYFSNTNKEQVMLKDADGTGLPIEKVNEFNLFRTPLHLHAWYTIEGAEYKALQFFDKNILFFPYANMSAN